MKTQMNIKLFMLSVLVFGLMCGATTALAQQERPGMNTLARLERALKAAGASELSSEQESEIRALITQFRDAHPRPVQNADIPEARRAYEEAILNRDIEGAAALAESIAKGRHDNMVQRQADAAAFAVNAIGILDPGQVDALTTQMGTTGLVRLALGLVNRPGGRGMMGRLGGARQGGLRLRAGRRLHAEPAIP